MKLVKLLTTGRMNHGASELPIVLAQKSNMLSDCVMGEILPYAHVLHRLPTENMKHRWTEGKKE